MLVSDTSFPVLEVLGVISFALSGISVAKSSDLDIVGIYACALLTALGGGTVRDILINHRPFYWVAHEFLLVLIFVLVVGSYAPSIQRLFGHWSRLTIIADAIGTGIFALNGLTLALSSGFGPLSSIMMAVITAIVGGVLRDIICGQIPYVFKRSELCATCALAGCIIYFLISALFPGLILTPFVVGAIVAGVLRYLALTRGLSLPW